MRSRGARRLSLLLASTLLLAACGGGDGDDEPRDDEAGGTTSATPTEDGSPTAEESEDGLTPPGSELELKESATFAWQPTQRLDGTVELAVNRLQRTTMADFEAFKLDRAARRSTPYYVHVTAENVGAGNLGGNELPLYLDNGSDVLFPSAKITSSFEPCPSRPLPDSFRPGKRARLCLVFLAPEETELEAVALRASEEVEPITWSGEVTRVQKKRPKRQD